MKEKFQSINWANILWIVLITINVLLSFHFMYLDRFDHATYHITLANMFLVFMVVNDIKNDIKEIKYRIWFRQDKYYRDKEAKLEAEIRVELEEERQNQGSEDTNEEEKD